MFNVFQPVFFENTKLYNKWLCSMHVRHEKLRLERISCIIYYTSSAGCWWRLFSFPSCLSPMKSMVGVSSF
jgi:hypothetical protein